MEGIAEIVSKVFHRISATLRSRTTRTRDAVMAAGCRAVGCGIVYRVQETDGVCLTFDDSPNPDFTPRILDALRRFEAPATFYCIGANVCRYPDLAKAIVEEGHELGNHTMTHADLYYVSPRRLQREVALCQEMIEASCGSRAVDFSGAIRAFSS